MYVTRHSNVINPELREKLWRLYELAYRRTAEEAVTREMYYRHEFDEVLADPANRLWVVWSDQEPIGSAVVATDIASTRYLSRAYFELHYPDHMLRGAVHYILWAVVHPSYLVKGVWVKLARETFTLEADEGALVVFDAPQINQPTERGGLAEMMARMAAMVSRGTPVEQVEVQRYFVTDFAQGRRYLEQAAEQRTSTRSQESGAPR